MRLSCFAPFFDAFLIPWHCFVIIIWDSNSTYGTYEVPDTVRVPHTCTMLYDVFIRTYVHTSIVCTVDVLYVYRYCLRNFCFCQSFCNSKLYAPVQRVRTVALMVKVPYIQLAIIDKLKECCCFLFGSLWRLAANRRWMIQAYLIGIIDDSG